MVSTRDRILKIIEYLESLGIKVNWCKNKARGNKGFFKANTGEFRIDISKELSEPEALRVLVHEFAHYIHYINDSTLKSLNFLNIEINDDILEELIAITVDLIPKDSIKPLFEMKESLENEIKNLASGKNNLFKKVELKNKQKILKRVESRIIRVNRYYNSYTELFARSIEMYVFQIEKFKLKAPSLYKLYSEFINKNDLMLNFIDYLLK